MYHASSLVKNDKRKARSCMWEIPKERGEGGRRRSKRLIRQTSWLVAKIERGLGVQLGSYVAVHSVVTRQEINPVRNRLGSGIKS